MIEKIISGGQTGADRAALDAAIKLGIDHGGWIPRGRRAEDGVVAGHYRLKQMPTADYPARTRQNVLDSDGTAILSRGPLTGGSKLTLGIAGKHGRPACVVDLSLASELEAAMALQSFVQEEDIRVLNVAGPRLSHQPWIYREVKTIIEVSVYLMLSDLGIEKEVQPFVPRGPFDRAFPETMEQAVDLIHADLPLKTRTFIARGDNRRTAMVYFIFQDYLKQRLGLDQGNASLVSECRRLILTDQAVTSEDAAMCILNAFRQKLEKDHVLRVVP